MSSFKKGQKLLVLVDQPCAAAMEVGDVVEFVAVGDTYPSLLHDIVVKKTSGVCKNALFHIDDFQVKALPTKRRKARALHS